MIIPTNYNSEDFNQEVLLPSFPEDDEEPLYLGVFSYWCISRFIDGYGGIKHCLIPAPKHIIIDRDETGNFVDYVYRNEQSVEEMFQLLGYINNEEFAGIEDRFCKEDFAQVFLQSVPYDGTSTWGKGADKGFEKFLDALENMELFDIETHTEVYQMAFTYYHR